MDEKKMLERIKKSAEPIDVPESLKPEFMEDILKEKEQKVIFLYYFEELTLKEISAVLEVTESRISQLHTRALQKMRTKLGGNMDLFFG